MERTLVFDTTKKVEKKILIKGSVMSVRDHGSISFIDLKDRTGILQIVSSLKVPLRVGDIAEVTGAVKKRPEKLVNKNIETGSIELQAGEIKVVEHAHEMPFDMGDTSLNVSLETLLDYRPLTLRYPKIQAIFKVQEVIVESFRKALKQKDFTEFFGPTLVPTATEGGAQIFPVKYFDSTIFLSQSPQLYKQIMVGVFERAFTVAHAYRAEPSVTTRHMTEYVSLDAEFGFINGYEDIMDVVEYVIKSIFKGVSTQCPKELAYYNATIPTVSKKFPRIKMREAQQIILKRTGRDNTNEPDLTPEDEREICKWALEEYKSDLIFITHYPTKKRPFYTYPDPADPDYTHSFDLLGRGLEWVTGGRRINNYDTLLENIKKWGNKPEQFEMYLQAFKYGMPPEGGFAIGAERVTMQILGLQNIREASLFPRDMERVDIKLSTLSNEKEK